VRVPACSTQQRRNYAKRLMKFQVRVGTETFFCRRHYRNVNENDAFRVALAMRQWRKITANCAVDGKSLRTTAGY